jgi:hypothetical protein
MMKYDIHQLIVGYHCYNYFNKIGYLLIDSLTKKKNYSKIIIKIINCLLFYQYQKCCPNFYLQIINLYHFCLMRLCYYEGN